jgi:hypothetical protein
MKLNYVRGSYEMAFFFLNIDEGPTYITPELWYDQFGLLYILFGAFWLVIGLSVFKEYRKLKQIEI